MRDKAKAWLARFSLYDTRGLSATVRKNLRLVILGVVIGNFSFTITGGTALTGYVKALGATDFVYAVLLAVPYIAKFMQLITSYIVERTRKRRELMLIFGLASRLSWILVALVPYFVPMQAQTVRIWSILILVLLLSCMGAFIDTSFTSLIADIVPMRIRGRYFSARQRMTMISGIVAGVVMSWLLDRFTADGSLAGYTIVFILAGIFGAGDIACFFWVSWPPMPEPHPGQGKESFPHMMREVLSNRSYMKLIALITIWIFAVNISTPFYNVQMLGPMAMSYTEINFLATIVSNVATLLLASVWGGVMDRYGNKAFTRVFTLLAGLIPLLWLFTGYRVIWMVPVVQFLSGMILPAIDLSVQNMYLYQAPERNRSMYFAIYFCVTQIVGVALSFAAGGWLVDNVFLPLSQNLNLMFCGFKLNQYHLVFLLSAALRFAVSLGLLGLLPETEGDCRPAEMLRGIRGDVSRRIQLTVNRK